MEGFLNVRLRPWVRRLITRGLAIVPAVIVSIMAGQRGTAQLLVLSQVVLPLQLSFAVVPLVRFTNDRVKMGRFANAPWLSATAWATAAVIAMAMHGHQFLADVVYGSVADEVRHQSRVPVLLVRGERRAQPRS